MVCLFIGFNFNSKLNIYNWLGNVAYGFWGVDFGCIYGLHFYTSENIVPAKQDCQKIQMKKLEKRENKEVKCCNYILSKTWNSVKLQEKTHHWTIHFDNVQVSHPTPSMFFLESMHCWLAIVHSLLHTCEAAKHIWKAKTHTTT